MFLDYLTDLLSSVKKQKNSKDPKPLEPIKSIKEIQQEELQKTPVVDEYDTPSSETVQEHDLPLEGEEVGSFTQNQKLSLEKEAPSPQRKKRSVPEHGKINKEDFKEFAGARILVAEDNLINQKVINGLLAESGIELVIADDGQIALDILEKDSNFLMVLMDAHMPNVYGFEATRRIRSNPKYDHIVVVALSGDTAADDIRKMTEAGMEEHLEKPLKMNDLYDVIYAYIGLNTPQAEEQVEEETYSAPQTKELNGAKGLEICGGDEAFYHEILDEFVATYADSTNTLLKLLGEDKIEEADRMLLDIIGVTANIGAEGLNEIAQHIKIALQKSNENGYIKLIEQYRVHLDALLRDIKAYK